MMLALRMGRTLSELRRKMSASEIMMWAEFDRFSPLGDERADIRAAQIADIRQVETTARYLGTALYWIAASINIKPGHDYYFYIRSVNTVGKSAFVEAVGQPSDDASGYLDFFKGEIG
ncbi:TPA: DUF4035 domain-containing protein, partial [Escherichia coli]|nr:DUF4035 domain-containing protein [Escherichia coli]